MSKRYVIFQIDSAVKFNTGDPNPRSPGNIVSAKEPIKFGENGTAKLELLEDNGKEIVSGRIHIARPVDKKGGFTSDWDLKKTRDTGEKKKKSGSKNDYSDLSSDIDGMTLVAIGNEISFQIGGKLKTGKFYLEFTHDRKGKKVELPVEENRVIIKKELLDDLPAELDKVKIRLIVEGESPEIELEGLDFLDDTNIKNVLNAYLANFLNEETEPPLEVREKVFKTVQWLVVDYFDKDIRNKEWDLDQVSRWIRKNYQFGLAETPD